MIVLTLTVAMTIPACDATPHALCNPGAPKHLDMPLQSVMKSGFDCQVNALIMGLAPAVKKTTCTHEDD